ncbi:MULTISPECIES: ABC transporter ATP-binding protein [Paenibacillus]|jgi:ABC-2 type transport system ATP-binding protein|uniref:ABC transporter ATP-binding protein n=1 Tax=Paenibacillus TaxID=44249 RepID=UPI00164E554F|nr:MULTISPECIES: ABC transporter ATP-binding protein [Paenibacillus]QNK59135.1 ABC transporter ATP-binding protein [Paenibacillus sp. PAMC21692]
MDKGAVIQVNQVSKHLGANHAIKQVSFQVRQGELFGVIGKSGAGKTTLLELISGQSKPDEGSVSVLGFNMLTDGDKLKEHINFLMGTTTLIDKMTVREALEMFQDFYQRTIDTDVVLKQFGLAPYADKIVKRLSGGLRQRTTLAISVVNDPEIIFLDEPTTGLDSQAKREYWSILAGLRLQGKTIVIISHDMTEIQYCCDRVGVMKEGQLVVCDSPMTLIEELPRGGLTMEAVYMEYAVGSRGGVEV